MKRILSILVICNCIFILAGCNSTSTGSDRVYSKPVIVLPDEDTAYNINGYKDTTPSVSSNVSSASDSSEYQSSDEYDGKYFGNKNTKKFHKNDCRYAKNMKEENLILFETRTDAKTTGYVECTVCNP